MRTPSSRLALAILVALAPAARAGSQLHVATYSGITHGASTTVTLPMFDPAIGVLRAVTLSTRIEISGLWAWENTNAFPVVIGGYGSPPYIGMSVPADFPWGGFGPSAPSAAYFHSMTPLAAYDGATDYGGTSGVSVPYPGASDGTGTLYSVHFYQPFLDLYSGTGTFTVGVGPGNRYAVAPAGIADGATITASGFVGVQYDYDPYPSFVCHGSGIGTNCPCSTSIPWPTIGGCANSQHAYGAELALTGTASLGNDSLVLLGTRMPNSSALYFQGTSFLVWPTPFGDGVRCAGGLLVRIGTRMNAGGSSQYPAPGDLPVSVRGGVNVPGLRVYQVLYRDGGAFCTPELFNTTNGYAVMWVP